MYRLQGATALLRLSWPRPTWGAMDRGVAGSSRMPRARLVRGRATLGPVHTGNSGRHRRPQPVELLRANRRGNAALLRRKVEESNPRVLPRPVFKTGSQPTQPIPSNAAPQTRTGTSPTLNRMPLPIGLERQYPGRDSNSHYPGPKPDASANWATGASIESGRGGT